MRQKPDIAHLRPFGCTTYAKIPKESGTSKIEAKSIKCVLLGYFGTGDYKLLDKATNQIIRSCNVIFEEGPFHSTAPQTPADDDDDIVHVASSDPKPTPDTRRDGNITTETPPTTSNTTKDPTGTTDSSADVPPGISNATPPTDTVIPRRSLRLTVPSMAAKEAQATAECIAQGANEGLDWARDTSGPANTAFATTTAGPTMAQIRVP
ncbi:hypothetical protein C0991_005186 [Blastosporella zonata]|nr:hypothetical protein C0991_005186 [Blastosporella zonata]